MYPMMVHNLWSYGFLAIFELECLPVGAAKVFLSAGVHTVPDHTRDIVRQWVAAAGA